MDMAKAACPKQFEEIGLLMTSVTCDEDLGSPSWSPLWHRGSDIEEFKNFFACMMNDIILEIYDLPKSYLACTLLAFTLIIHTAFKYWLTNKNKDESLLGLIQTLKDSNEGLHKKILSLESANHDLQNRLLNLESANLMQELQSINNKCIAKIGFVDNKYEYLMDRTLTLQSDVVTTKTQCKEERLSLIDKIRSLESCVSEEHNRWYDSMKNLESQAREEVHSLEQTLCARLQALEETLCKHDKEPNKQKGKTIKVITSPNGSNPMAYPVIIHERPADDTHPEPYVTHSLQPISIRDFKNMKEAIVTYGIHSTYVKQMLNSWSTSNRIIPDDWHQLTSAVLEYSQQLQWKSWFREEARNLEQQGSISNLLGIMGIPKDGLQNLANTLEGDKDLNSPRELSPEAEKELALVEKTIREAHVDRVNPELKCILVILPSRHSPTGILMQREDVILEWIFLPRKPNKKLKTYIEKISDLIHKGKLRLRQLTGMDPAEIVVPLTNEEVSSLWKDNEYWQRACSNFLGEINNRYPKSKRIEFIKKTEWVLPHIVRQKPISGVLTFYTDANKLGKAGYKSGDLSKVVQSPYNSVQKAELYAILMVLMDFTEPLNIVTDSQYAERVVLHIETAEFIPDNTELTSLFIQLQEIIRNREHPIYITHIRSHTGLPGPLAQGNDEIDQLLIGNVLEASEFHKKHHVNSKGLKKDFAITWQQAKDIVKKCPTCSFYNQTPLPAGSNPKGIQRNEIWQMDVFHFMEFGRLKYVHHTIDTYSGFQWATPMSSEKADSVITHLLEVMAIMGIPVQIKTDNAPAYVSNKMRQFFAYYNIRHVTGIPHNPTGQAVIERSNRTLKDMLNKQQQVTMTPRNRLHSALLTLNFLNADEKGTTAAERHWTTDKTSELNQPVYFKDVLSSEWKPGYVLRWGRGFAFVSAGEEKLWIPTKLIKIRFEQEKPLDKEK
ncbi:hypothetical protein STEG23_021666 [Scotinomys teguina]